MSAIVDFVTAQLDKAAASAMQAQEPEFDGDSRNYYTASAAYRDSWGLWTYHVPTLHILADIASKRAILELHKPIEVANGDGWFDWECNTCRWTYGAHGVLACQTLRLLAEPYVDHPDFLPEWRL